MTNDENEKQPEDFPEAINEILNDAAAADSANIAPADAPAPNSPEFFEAAIKAVQAEADAAKDKMMRALADAENTRRRAMKERDDAGKYAVSSFAKDLLDFSDNFERAIAAIPPEVAADEKVASIVQGIEAMNAQLLQTFARHGIKKIEPLDEVFNPNFHEVMFEAPIPGKPGGVVIQVVEAGYILNDRLLRAAKVGISKGDGTTTQVDQSA
jgi:molecular chaperone GrpE